MPRRHLVLAAVFWLTVTAAATRAAADEGDGGAVLDFDSVSPQALSSGTYGVILTMKQPLGADDGGPDTLRMELANIAIVPQAAVEVTVETPMRVRAEGVGSSRGVCNALLALSLRREAVRARLGVAAMALVKLTTSDQEAPLRREFQALSDTNATNGTSTATATATTTSSSVYSATASTAPSSFGTSAPYTYSTYTYSAYTFSTAGYATLGSSSAPSAGSGNASTTAPPPATTSTAPPAAAATTTAAPVLAVQPNVTAPQAVTIAMSATLRISGSSFAALLAGGPATSEPLAIAVRTDIGTLLGVDASTVFITNMYVGSLVVDFSVSADAAVNSTVMTERLARATDSAVWLASTQTVYGTVSNEQLRVTDAPLVVRSGIRYSTPDTPAPMLASPSPAAKLFATNTATVAAATAATAILLLVVQ